VFHNSPESRLDSFCTTSWTVVLRPPARFTGSGSALESLPIVLPPPYSTCAGAGMIRRGED